MKKKQVYLKISLDELIGDSLYQLNLLLLMLQPSKYSTVKPLFFEVGFKLHQIEPKLTIPQELQIQIVEDEIMKNPNSECVPEIIIKNESRCFVIFECKKSMFGSIINQGESQIRQAQKYLLQTPEILIQSLNLAIGEISESSLVYFSKHDDSVNQTQGLRELKELLDSKKYKTIDFGLIGLSHNHKFVFFNKNNNDSYLCEPLNKLFKKDQIVVQEIRPNEDPRSYYPFPWMPTGKHIKDNYAEESFGNAVIQMATMIIGQSSIDEMIILDSEDIIFSATNGFSEFWGNNAEKKRLKKVAKDFLKNLIVETNEEIKIEFLNDYSLGLNIISEKSKQKLIEYLGKWKFAKWTIPLQPSFNFEDFT